MSDRALELQLTDYFLYNGCALHDTQNALKCAIQPYANGNIMQDCHIIMESLRNSATPIFASLPLHLQNAIVIREQPEAAEDVLAEFWTTIGELSPHFWSSLWLWIYGTLAWRWLSMLLLVNSQTPLVLWPTAPRCSCVGDCSPRAALAANGLLGSLAVGLQHMVKLARSSPLTSTYHLNGFNRLSTDSILLIVILTVVGGLVNAVQRVLLEDSRLLLQ